MLREADENAKPLSPKSGTAATEMSTTPRDFKIYLSNGHGFTVQAPSLRKALSTEEKDVPDGAEIVAALDVTCLPPPSAVAALSRGPVAQPLLHSAARDMRAKQHCFVLLVSHDEPQMSEGKTAREALARAFELSDGFRSAARDCARRSRAPRPAKPPASGVRRPRPRSCRKVEKRRRVHRLHRPARDGGGAKLERTLFLHRRADRRRARQAWAGNPVALAARRSGWVSHRARAGVPSLVICTAPRSVARRDSARGGTGRPSRRHCIAHHAARRVAAARATRRGCGGRAGESAEALHGLCRLATAIERSHPFRGGFLPARPRRLSRRFWL